MVKKLFTKYTLILLLVLGLAQVVISVAYSNFGGTIKELNENSKEITLDNQRLNLQAVKLQSLTIIASRAGELGFEKSEVLYLTPQTKEALLPTSGKTN